MRHLKDRAVSALLLAPLRLRIERFRHGVLGGQRAGMKFRGLLREKLQHRAVLRVLA